MQLNETRTDGHGCKAEALDGKRGRDMAWWNLGRDFLKAASVGIEILIVGYIQYSSCLLTLSFSRHLSGLQSNSHMKFIS